MSPEDLSLFEDLLSLEHAPAASLTAEERGRIIDLHERVNDEASLAALAARTTKALATHGDNLRARLALALYQEVVGDAEEAGRGLHHLARELAKRNDWVGVRELAVRALPLWPENRVARLMLEAWSHLPDKQPLEEDLALAQSVCPESPDLMMLDVARLDQEGRTDHAEAMAVDALNGFVALKEPDRAEEPLLRVLESNTPAVYRQLLRTLPRMARQGLGDLLSMALELADARFSALGMKRDLAGVLERLLLRRKGFENLRSIYVKALVESLGGGEGVASFVSDCGLDDPAKPLDGALARFREMYNLRPGAFVEHTSFGVGRITAHDGDFLVIDFADRPGHRLALEIAGRSLRTLPDACLRVAEFSAPDAIAHEIAHDPAGLLVRALNDLGGSASARELRECLAGSTIADDDWSAWWKRARESAQGDGRVDTSQAFRQIYRLPGGDEEDEEFELPPLPSKGGAQGATTLIERLLKQHPELEDRAKETYGGALVERALAGPAGSGMPAVPLLMRWMPERRKEWVAVANAALRREPGVAAAMTADQQQELLDLGLSGSVWKEAAISALGSRYPAIRDQGMKALAERLGAEEAEAAVHDLLLSAAQRPNTALAVIRLGLSDGLAGVRVSPWELFIAALRLIASEPTPKLRDSLLDLVDPQERLAEMLRGSDLDEELADLFVGVSRGLVHSETGPDPLFLMLSSTGHSELMNRLRSETVQEVFDPIAIHFDPAVTLMSRVTFEQNQEKIQDLQHQLSAIIPKEIGAARALGDLKENAEYHAARERQGIADATVRSLKSQMENARVIEEMHFPEGSVAAGTEVVLRDLADDQERTFWVLGHGDSIQDNNVINYRAPLGQALVGKQLGEIVEAELGETVLRLEVLSITRKLP